MRYGVILTIIFVVGCVLSHGEIEITDGVKWQLYGNQDSCIIMKFNDKTIRGDLHIEFLTYGLLVSRWDKSMGRHHFSYINLRDSTYEIIDDDISVGNLRKTCNVRDVRSYSLSCIVGKNRIDSEFNSFYAECENLKQRLKVKHL